MFLNIFIMKSILQQALLIICLLLLNMLLCAQSSAIDSLQRLIQGNNDTLRIDALNELSRIYVSDSLLLSERLAQQALREARTVSYTKGILFALRNLGIIADIQGNTDKAVSLYNEGLAIAEGNAKWQKEHASLLLNKGIAYFYADDLGKALENYVAADAIYTNLDDDYAYARLLNNLAVVYRRLNRYDEAIKMYEKSLKIKKNTNDSIGIAATYNNIGLVYGYKNEYEYATSYLKRARALYQALQEWTEVQSIDISLANALYEMKRIEEAKQVLLELFSSERINIPPYNFLLSKLLLVKIYLFEKDYPSAHDVLETYQASILQTNFNLLKKNFYDLQAHTLQGLGKYEEAYDALLEYKFYADTLLSEERLKLEAEMETKYLTKEKENIIAIQQLQLQKNKRERLVYIIALSALMLIIFLAQRLLQLRRKAHTLLKEKNIQIEQALHEKELLLKEIHHRVKNNLQIISSLLSLQSRQIDDPKALEAIQEGRNRVNSMALIHQNLYQDEDLVGVDAVEYIEKLTDSLVANYNINPHQITIAKDLDPLKLDVDTIIPLGLIINELISNTLKYAFPNGRAGKMYIALKQETKALRLRIADNGKGLPPNFDLHNLKSLGFRLVKAFTQKLEGELNIQSEQGVIIDIYIPNYKTI